MKAKTTYAVLAAVLAAGAFAADPYNSPGPGTRYATDAYPGFDREENILPREKKTPGFFSWWSGPKRDDPSAQLEWAEECEAAGSWGKARRAYNALVAQWPYSAEAPVAQKKLADMLLEKVFDYQEAFEEYKYLADFYSSRCDFDGTLEKMYEAARAMREEGKRILFFRFANTTDVRRAFEATVVRASGAKFAPEAMLTIAALREDDGELDKAFAVYENLRNLYPRSKEAKDALLLEARTRMRILDERGYNRSRCLDTVAFLKMATAPGRYSEGRDELLECLAVAQGMVEDEDWNAAKFYDSKMRTKASAISAYERFAGKYPASPRAEEARARMAELKEGAK